LESYWGQKLLKKFSKRWTIILFPYGENEVLDHTQFMAPKKELGVIAEYERKRKDARAKVYGVREDSKANHLSKEP
jgi:hypothetical protein